MNGQNTQKSSAAQQLLTVSEAAKQLKLTEKALRQILHRGAGPPLIRLGPRTIRISRVDLDRWVFSKRG